MSAAICEFCGAVKNLDVCDWPVWEWMVERYWRLCVGDRVRRFQEARDLRAPAVVQEIGQGPGVKLRMVLRIGSRLKEIVVRPESRVRVERDRNCERVCCERCRVERGPGATYCAEHWQAWEAYPT